MTAREILLIAAGLAALAVPSGVLAQQYDDRQDQSQYSDPYNGGYPNPDGNDYGSQYRHHYSDSEDGQYRRGYEPDQGYGPPRGDWDQGQPAAFRGYPEFTRIEAQISREIEQGLSDNSLDRNGAADLNARLQRIQDHEMREFEEYGWNLPEGDRAQIRQELDQLDRWVDETRQGS
jgi:hypothetical protein